MLGTNELPTDVEGGRILPINLVGEMKRSFISYAMAVIISRALPDVRDGHFYSLLVMIFLRKRHMIFMMSKTFIKMFLN